MVTGWWEAVRYPHNHRVLPHGDSGLTCYRNSEMRTLGLSGDGLTSHGPFLASPGWGQAHTPEGTPLLSSVHPSSWNLFCDSSSYSCICFLSVPGSDWAPWGPDWIFFIFLLPEYLTFCLVHSKCLVVDLNFTSTTFLKTLLYYLRLYAARSNNFSSMLSSFSCDESGDCWEVAPPQMALGAPGTTNKSLHFGSRILLSSLPLSIYVQAFHPSLSFSFLSIKWAGNSYLQGWFYMLNNDDSNISYFLDTFY